MMSTSIAALLPPPAVFSLLPYCSRPSTLSNRRLQSPFYHQTWGVEVGTGADLAGYCEGVLILSCSEGTGVHALPKPESPPPLNQGPSSRTGLLLWPVSWAPVLMNWLGPQPLRMLGPPGPCQAALWLWIDPAAWWHLWALERPGHPPARTSRTSCLHTLGILCDRASFDWRMK